MTEDYFTERAKYAEARSLRALRRAWLMYAVGIGYAIFVTRWGHWNLLAILGTVGWIGAGGLFHHERMVWHRTAEACRSASQEKKWLP
jgi:hypothetical protein